MIKINPFSFGSLKIGRVAATNSSGAGRLYVYNTGNSAWEEAKPAGDMNQDWSCASMYLDGQTSRVIACIASGKMYLHNGAVWSELYSTAKAWYCCANISDKVIAGEYGGRLYYYDGNWSEQGPAGYVNKNWTGCSITTGNRMLVCARGGRLYYYNGSSWSEQTPGGSVNLNWAGCSIEPGGKMAACVDGGKLYRYTGSYWTEETPAGSGNKYWKFVKTDSYRILAGMSYGRLYYYNGSSWAEQTPGGSYDYSWTDGTIINGNMIACNSYGHVFYYNGSSWAYSDPAGGGYYKCCAIP